MSTFRLSGPQETARPWLYLVLSYGAWVAAWGALNTGGGGVPAFQRLVQGGAPLEALHFLRALIPVALLLLWVLHLAGRSELRIRRPSRVERLLLLYGVVGLLAGLTRAHTLYALYWGLAFLAPFAAAELILVNGDRLEKSRLLNRLTWTITGLVLVALVVASGDALFIERGMGLSGYGVFHRVESIAGMPAVRASGIGRLAGVVAVVTLASALFSSRWKRMGWAGLSAAAWLLVWVLQSRGSLAAAGAAGLFITGVWFRGESLLASTVFLSLAGGLALTLLPADLVEGAIQSGIRLPSESALDPSGRPDAWKGAWEAFQTGPLSGRGFQADRTLAGRNAQSGVLYAFLTGGVVGGAAYLGALLLLWHRLLALLSQWGRFARRNQRTLLQAGGLIVLFTVRHYPENTTALYSVDLLVLLPALLFVVELERARRRQDEDASNASVHGTG